MNIITKCRNMELDRVIHEKAIDILEFPDEIIIQIFSFLALSKCLNIRDIASCDTILTKLIDVSIYSRIVVYKNRTSHSFLRNRYYKKPYEVVDQEELYKLITNRNIIHECIKPQRFVLSFTANSRNRTLREEELFLNVFGNAFQQHIDYFRQAIKFELYMDLGNKDHEVGKIKQEFQLLQRLLNSGELCHNLTTLNIVKGQNYFDTERNEITDLLNSTLHTFKNLQTIFLSTNNLQNISNLKYPEGLRSLDLIYNMIVKLPTNRLWLPPNLRYLNLSCNEITSLKGVEFPGMIEYMDIQLNAITCLSNIKFPQNLKTLIACGNEITIEDSIVIDLPPCLEILNLLQNPFENDLSSFNIPDSLRKIYLDAHLKEVNSIQKKNHIVVYY